MCGISGVINVNSNVNINNIKNMTDIIRHRGPDDEGFYLCSKNFQEFACGKDTISEVKNSGMTSIDTLNNDNYFLALGHRRLSIIDLSAKGHQPMNCFGITITYNGEIYNYLEIKNELKGYGYDFETDGDTEVIVCAYKHWGEDCVKHFNGMWSFALWDKGNHKLFCSRDRLGEKPFYYYFDGEEFIFGSEIKQLIEYGVIPIVNEKLLFAYIFYGIQDFSEETFFKEIFSLRGGYSISMKISPEDKLIDFNKYRYWELNNEPQKQSESFENESINIGRALEESIKIRLRSDVEIGSCLSGGLDSSSIVTLACKKLIKDKNYDTKNFKTFTSCYDYAKEVDERYYSDLVVGNSNCSNIKVKPNAFKIKDDLKSIIWHQDEPFVSLSIFAGWCVMEEAAKAGVKVLLDGQGGDESLLGYERFYSYSIKDKINKLQFIEAFKEFKSSSKNSKLSLKRLSMYLIYFNNIKIRKSRLKSKKSKFIESSFLKRFINTDILDNMLQIHTLAEAQDIELNQAISHLLRYEDRNSMAQSIEARVPFLDYEFVEKAVNLPTSYKLRDGWTKAILRKYMEDKMPDEVVYRKNKLGFGVPQEMWLNELNDYFRDTLLDNPKSAKYFNINNIEEIFCNKSNADMRFKFIVVETWMRVFNINA